MQILVIDPNTAGTAFAWMLLLIGLCTIMYFIYEANKTDKAKRIVHRNDLCERRI